MPTQKQRRDAARRHLERQLQRRAEKDAARKRFTLIASIVGTLIIIAIVVVAITMASSDSSTPAAKKGTSTTPTAAPTTPTPAPSTSYPAATGAAVTFDGVTVKGAKDLNGVPAVTSKSSKDPAKLEYKDLVVGTGAAATPTDTVNVQYVGVLYKDGTEFDSSWGRGAPATFSLTGVVPGFTQGIGGGSGVPPMKVGGRRIIIMPAAMGYGANPPQGANIPANAPLVFVVDLKSVTK